MRIVRFWVLTKNIVTFLLFFLCSHKALSAESFPPIPLTASATIQLPDKSLGIRWLSGGKTALGWSTDSIFKFGLTDGAPITHFYSPSDAILDLEVNLKTQKIAFITGNNSGGSGKQNKLWQMPVSGGAPNEIKLSDNGLIYNNWIKVQYSPGGDKIVVMSSLGIGVYDSNSGVMLNSGVLKLGPGGNPEHLSFDHTGKVLAFMRSKAITLLNLEVQPFKLSEIKIPDNYHHLISRIDFLKFSPHSNYLILGGTSSSYTAYGFLMVFDPISGNLTGGLSNENISGLYGVSDLIFIKSNELTVFLSGTSKIFAMDGNTSKVLKQFQLKTSQNTTGDFTASPYRLHESPESNDFLGMSFNPRREAYLFKFENMGGVGELVNANKVAIDFLTALDQGNEAGIKQVTSDPTLLKKLADFSGPGMVRPLHIAAKRGNIEAMKVLLGAGGSFARGNVDMDTPLMFAVQSGNLEVVSWIMSYLAEKKDSYSIDYSNKKSVRAIDLAMYLNRLDLVKIIFEKGAKIDHWLGYPLANLKTIESKCSDCKSWLILQLEKVMRERGEL